MSSAATEISNVMSKVKDYDVYVLLSGGVSGAVEYAGLTLPGRAGATSYNLLTNLRNIQESAGDGEYNSFVLSVPVSLAQWKVWHDSYDKAGKIEIKSTIDPTLSAAINVRLSEIADFDGAFDAINPVDISFQMTGFAD